MSALTRKSRTAPATPGSSTATASTATASSAAVAAAAIREAPRRDLPAPAGQAVQVLFIAGFGRSGSTLLDRLLGSQPGLHSGGEVGGLWSQGLVEDRLCSCGTSFSRCGFWRAVGARGFSSLSAQDAAEVVRYLQEAFPARRIWRLFIGRARRRLVTAAPAAFSGTMARIYQGLRDVSGSQMVIDSSKLATYLVLLAEVPSLDVHVLHLVRDPRAVAHSWGRPAEMDPDGRSSTPHFGAVKSAVLWLMMNAAVEWVARRLDLPYVRVRYEDLVREPGRGVTKILAGLAAGHAELDLSVDCLAAGAEADLGVAHIISGNPMRFRHGPMPIAEDVRWKSGPRGRRAVVAAITFPLRWRYGY